MNLRQIPTLSLLLLAFACGDPNEEGATPSPGSPGMGMGMSGDTSDPSTSVPVQVALVERRSISRFLQTNGTLEAEDEVDIVARTVGPITELVVEEGDMVRSGQLLARIDDREAQNQMAIAGVTRDEAHLAFQRAQTTFEGGLVSQEAFDTAQSNLRTAEVQLESAALQLAYTEIKAPFDALVAVRHIKMAQYVTAGMPLFRISDFTPLLCPIQVPEKDLGRLRKGQSAHLQVEAYPGQDFPAKVLRIRPTLEAGTGTVAVTLEVEGRRELRPGMFARVFLETDKRQNAIVIPREALVLDSIGDTVFVREGDIAVRRDLHLGFREGAVVEVLEGLSPGDELIVLGQDGLADGTPVAILEEKSAAAVSGDDNSPGRDAPIGIPEEQLEEMRSRMRERGLSDEQIEERLQQIRDGGGRPPRGSARGEAGPPPAGGGIPPMMEQRIRDADPEDLERIKERMKQFGMDEEQIETTVKRIRGGDKTRENR
ncbi:MAG: efflux RND transporter periplasmic adaptor subunit [Thermoanaerobaculales bacterium]|nr:efflux RND transporter periplasmic adaptor subunit [Thermoanaerobaculales bacterium]